eukprot:GHVU01008261.1.p2 GENE.GHVU01008261.1~~GHVU01008261.1.p2  ORF type:complete len:222 (-),score=24.00 GHVU01008261.1:1465-2130(-)
MRSPVVGSRGPQLELKHLFLPAGAGSEKLSCPRVRLIGAPMARGQAQPGVETAPKKVREAGLLNALQGLGVSVADHGDVVPNANENDLEDNSENESQDKIERVYTQIGRFNGRLYEAVKAAADAGDFVLTIGGDHGVATGTISGMLAKYPDLAVIWVDAHADCNTPATSPSGNYHVGKFSMPASARTCGPRADRRPRLLGRNAGSTPDALVRTAGLRLAQQ